MLRIPQTRIGLMPTKCCIHNCTKPTVAKGYCNTHYVRIQRNGDLDTRRPEDWGQRHKHRAYNPWRGLRRFHEKDIPQEWIDDFWAFVADVPERPAGRSTAFRPDSEKPFGKDNFYWKEPISDFDYRTQRTEYMRDWRKKVSAANPEYGKNAFMKRAYGVTLDWFNEQLAKQNSVCAICDKPETAVIHGKQISLAVDHCHDTGKVRGLLCRACNNAIGALEHNPERFRRAIEYLAE
jgi:hypothetical protein